MKRYGILFVVAAALSGILYSLAGQRVAPSRLVAQTEPDSVAVTLVLTDQGVEPSVMTVTKDHRVALSIINHRRLAAGVSLQGYQHAFAAGIIAPGTSWHGSFIADRPGEDFAWMVEGEPSGRFIVKGSHLVEGHR